MADSSLCAESKPMALHYWIVAGTTNKKMRLRSSGDGIVCAYCRIAYCDAQSMNGCPGRDHDA